MLPLAHELDRQVAAAHQDVRLAASRGSGAADVVVGEAAGGDDGRVAHPARHLEEEAARRGAAADVAARVDGGEVDGPTGGRLAQVVPAELIDEVLHVRVE